jgi:preprotein translocase subunit SecG
MKKVTSFLYSLFIFIVLLLLWILRHLETLVINRECKHFN